MAQPTFDEAAGGDGHLIMDSVDQAFDKAKEVIEAQQQLLIRYESQLKLIWDRYETATDIWQRYSDATDIWMESRKRLAERLIKVASNHEELEDRAIIEKLIGLYRQFIDESHPAVALLRETAEITKPIRESIA